MKIAFSKCVEYVPEWNGNRKLPPADQVRCRLNVIDMGDLFLLLDVFQKLGISGKVDTDAVTTTALTEVIREAGRMIPKYVQVENLTWPDGSAVTPSDMAGLPNFLHLDAELLMKLAEISAPTDTDEKNSSAPQS